MLTFLGVYITPEYGVYYCVPNYTIQRIYLNSYGKILVFDDKTFTSGYLAVKKYVERKQWVVLEKIPNSNLTTLFDTDLYLL